MKSLLSRKYVLIDNLKLKESFKLLLAIKVKKT